jgi:hypothetical protein
VNDWLKFSIPTREECNLVLDFEFDMICWIEKISYLDLYVSVELVVDLSFRLIVLRMRFV